MKSVVEKAADFVKRNGNNFQKAAMNHVISGCRISNIEKLERELSAYQNGDGGFSNGLETEYDGNISSPLTTAAALGYIYFFGLKDTEIMKKTWRYLAATQKNDGCWDDEEGILEFDIPPYMGPGVYTDYKTAMILKWLFRLGYAGNGMTEKALFFLSEYFKKISDSDDFWSAAAYVSLFSEIPGSEEYSEILEWGMKVLAKSVPDSGNGDIPWEQVQGMIYEDSPAVFGMKETVLERIRENQLPDGSWPHRFGTYNAVWAAVLICRYIISVSSDYSNNF